MPSKAKRRPPNDAEHREQVWLFQWVAFQMRKHPELKTLYAIPNGGQRNKAVAAKLKAEGVKAGVHDMHLPVSRGGFIGLWIELKIKPNKPTATQLEWAEQMLAEGHEVHFCYGWREAKDRIEEYLALPKTTIGGTKA